MAMFAGNWEDPYGVPFDEGAFKLGDLPGGGIARKRRVKVRPSSLWLDVRASFAAVARFYKDNLTTDQKVDWEIIGRTFEHQTRDGQMQKLHQVAFYQRCIMPSTYIDGKQELYTFAEPPWPTPILPGLVYDEIADTFTCSYTTYSDARSWPYTGIQMFQIEPRAAGKYWECSHTRLIACQRPMETDDAVHQLVGAAHWTVRPHQQARCLLRAWFHHTYHRAIQAWWW